MKPRAVVYNADASGYRVLVLAGGRIVREYMAGNNPHDSYSVASPGYPAVPARQLLAWARRTSLEMAVKLQVPRAMVARDRDIEI